MQFENPLPTSFSSSGSVMTSTASFTNHQPTPAFYIDNLLGPTPSVSDETESSTTPGTLGLNNDQDQGSVVGGLNSSPNIGGILTHPSDGLLQTGGNCIQEQRSPENNLISGLRPLNSPYCPVVSNVETHCGSSFLSPPSPILQNGISPPRPSHVTRPIVPTPIQAVPAHHPNVLGYPATGGYSRSTNIYDPTAGPIHNPYNASTIPYNPTPYGAPPPSHLGSRLDAYSYPRNDYTWIFDRHQVAYNKGTVNFVFGKIES